MASSSTTPAGLLGKGPQANPKDGSIPSPPRPSHARFSSVVRGVRGRSRSRGRSRARKSRALLGNMPPLPPSSNVDGSSSSLGQNAKEKWIPCSDPIAAPVRPSFAQREQGEAPVVGATRAGLIRQAPSSDVADQAPTRSWAAVTRSATKGYNLSYVPPATIDNKVIVQISDEILQAAHPKWDDCLVGYYIGKRLPFRMTEDALKHARGNHLAEVIVADLGFYYFHIPDKEFRRKVLEGGPITVAKIPLVLQQWHPFMKLEKECHKSVPVWLRLRNIPVNLWSASGISALASALGKPLYVDSRTEQMAMVAYARVCVEIEASSSFPEAIDFLLNGDLRSVDVQYEWLPMLCPKCCTFGHRCADPQAPALPKDGSKLSKAPSAIPSSEWREVRGKRNVRIHDPDEAPPPARSTDPPLRGIESHHSAPQVVAPKLAAPAKNKEEAPPPPSFDLFHGTSLVPPLMGQNVPENIVPEMSSSSDEEILGEINAGSDTDSPKMVASSIPEETLPPQIPPEPLRGGMARQKGTTRSASTDADIPPRSKPLPSSVKNRGGKKR
ncbi:hypothetical protein ACJRO7_019820 [Eucalyptus globulus]|uniref:DUF4283 domain-containing protein n=1 Tax=Eucalyptus globulus TaxID=34317 RepID=A0ABD3KL89_EUCGL